MAFLRALSVFDHAGWMNAPVATYLAESKPYQLLVAANCGFQVPATLATNDANRIRQNLPGSLVIKSLDTVLLREGEDCLFTYTILTPDGDLNDRAVSAAPLLAQHAFQEKTDLRVTVGGDKIFAVRILSNGSGILGDWRLVPREEVEFQDIVPDAVIAELCFALTRQLNLNFAAIDLIETPQDIFFIEVNPTGEWGWLSTTERPIESSIASWLTSPPEDRS